MPNFSRTGLGAQPRSEAGELAVGGVLFLESSPYVTGEVIHIDGGKIAGH